LPVDSGPMATIFLSIHRQVNRFIRSF